MSILIKPIITEKMSLAEEVNNCYGFVVAKGANKIQVKTAVEKAYNVTVESVRTMNTPVKRKARNTRAGMVIGKIGSYKKAIVKLAEGDSIDFYNI
ncbi:MAG: 50S ribosomal protein L23 [Flavobacteriales bacterium]